MEMILTGIENKNEYYTNHYFTSIFQDNAEDTIRKWKKKEKEEEIQLPWKKLRDVRTQYYNIRDRYLRSKNEEVSKPMVQELATLYLKTLGYESINSVSEEVADGLNVPIFHEVTKANGAPLLWAFLSVAAERDDDILQGYIFEKSDDEDENGASVDIVNDEILAKLFFAGEEAPRFILLFGINQIALIDRSKWNEKRYLQFMMEDIYSRHEESTFMAMTVLLHKESLCPADGAIVLDSLDENSHKHSAGVSDALKYALRESIGEMISVPCDALIKILGKDDLYFDSISKLPLIKSVLCDEIVARALALNCMTSYYSDIWNELESDRLASVRWTKNDVRLNENTFLSLGKDWTKDSPLRTPFERRQAMVELDVLVAMGIGMSKELLTSVYNIQFPVLKSYEVDTWYDQKGRVVFTTNRTQKGVGFNRTEWEKEVKNTTSGTVKQIITESYSSDEEVEKMICYEAPFNKCDREDDYKIAWDYFSKKYKL